MSFELVESRALDLANKPYVAPDKESLPEWMKNLTYDQYRDIRFDPEKALWADDKIAFRVMFFHPGYLFREPVAINEFTDTHRQRVRLAEAFFNYGSLIKNHGELPSDGGFAGFRLHAPLNGADYYDELAVFQGASYWRALGKNQRYGISARGVAVDTGAEGVPEEFPSFREFWLKKPVDGENYATILALLDGPSYSGAYSFNVQPGDDTIMNVKAVLFARKEVKRLGIAPMSSMFWFGENSRRKFDDFRPEVHDSDGLAIRMGTGERVWRPITNDTGNLEFSFFEMEKCEGFGLLQRDRRFNAYEDGEAAYHQRPSLWIEPTSDWGSGSVMLMEIPTGNELADNTVAMWQPAKTPKAGERVEFSYKQHWTMAEDPSQAGGHVVATRTGVHEWQADQRTMIVEFEGNNLVGEDGKMPEAFVQPTGEAAEKIKIQGIAVQPMPEGRLRLAFQIAPVEEGVKLAAVGPVELRCALKRGDDFLSETWVYRINP
ncbi:MAG: glucan biosynthesis protein [Armatimonadetes bacterium]|nr:glucan biosynthesis protein [Akkermansiaceae bacterium]